MITVIAGPQKHTNWSLVVSRFQGIEQLKKEERRWAKKTKWMNMRAVFGHPFSILWFSPFSTPDHGKAETYQYVVWRLSTGSDQNQSGKACTPPPHTHTQLNAIYTVYPTLAMDSFSCAFFVLPTKCSIRFIFVLPWVSRVAEKKKHFTVVFANTVMDLLVSDLLSFSSIRSPSLFLLFPFSFSLKG